VQVFCLVPGSIFSLFSLLHYDMCEEINNGNDNDVDDADDDLFVQ